MTESVGTAAALPDHVLLQTMDTGEAVMLDLENESYFGLNEVGARIVDLLTSLESVDAVLKALTLEYDADAATLRRDIADLIEALRARGLLTVA